MKLSLFVIIAGIALYSCSHKTAPVSSQPAAVNEVKPPEDTPKPIAVKMESPQVIAGKEIYTTKCARCHGIKRVEDWTVAEWIPIIDRMAPKSRLDETEKANVTAYVNFHAKSGS